MFIESNRYEYTINRLALTLLCILPLAIFPDGRRLNAVLTKSMLLACVSTVFFILILIQKEKSFRLDLTESRWLFGYLTLVLISTFFALNPQLAIFGSKARKDGLVTMMFYVVAYSIGRQMRIKESFLKVLGISIALVSTFALMQSFQIDPDFLELYPESWKGLAFASMGNPNFLGSYLVLALPFPMFLYLLRRKHLGLVLYSMAFFALLATRTRGSWIGALIGWVVMIYLCKKQEKKPKVFFKRVLILALVSLLLFGLFLALSDEVVLTKILAMFTDFRLIMTRPEDADMAGTNRFYIWKRCIELIKERPIFGYGVENMSVAMRNEFHDMIVKDWGRFRNWDKAHNEYLNIAVASGIPSLIMYLGFTITVIRKGLKKLTHCPLLLPFAAAAIGYMSQAFFNIQMVVVYYFFMVVLGILASEVFCQEEYPGPTTN